MSSSSSSSSEEEGGEEGDEHDGINKNSSSCKSCIDNIQHNDFLANSKNDDSVVLELPPKKQKYIYDLLCNLTMLWPQY